MNYLVSVLTHFFRVNLWRMPDGFATLLGGFFVLIAAIVAFIGVKRQIKTQLDTEDRRFRRERDALKFAIYSEMMMYVEPIAKVFSSINTHFPPVGGNKAVLIPPFVEPYLFKSLHEKIGVLGDTRAIMRVLSFYVNLINVIESLKPDTNNFIFPTVIAPSFQRMTLNLCDALTLLGPPRKSLPLPSGIDVHKIVYWGGRRAEQLNQVPSSIQDFLLEIAGGDISLMSSEYPPRRSRL